MKALVCAKLCSLALVLRLSAVPQNEALIVSRIRLQVVVERNSSLLKCLSHF
jgi:hypothetical protein